MAVAFTIAAAKGSTDMDLERIAGLLHVEEKARALGPAFAAIAQAARDELLHKHVPDAADHSAGIKSDTTEAPAEAPKPPKEPISNGDSNPRRTL